LERDRSVFENSAQGQQFGQNLGRAQFGNAAQAQAFGQNMQQANFGNDARSQYLTELYGKRNQGINEIGALLGTGSVQSPQFQQTPGGTAPTTDFAGIQANNYNQQMNAWQQQQANNPWGGLMGGLFGLGQAGIMSSDRRLKRDVSFLGMWRNLPIYAYRYIWGGPMRVGVMAQDMLRLRPEVVHVRGGFLAVDYGAL
jgi:hypothetical protein